MRVIKVLLISADRLFTGQFALLSKGFTRELDISTAITNFMLKFDTAALTVERDLIVLPIGSVMLLGGLLLSQAMHLNASAASKYDSVTTVRSNKMLNASPEEVAQQALVFAGSMSPHNRQEVVLTRKVTPAELPELGLNKISELEPNHPLTLVILKGDIIVNMPTPDPPDLPKKHYKYVAYVYDMFVDGSMPCSIMTSLNGSRFKKVLNDPTLPDDPRA